MRMKLGFHTDAFSSAYWSFDKCFAWAAGLPLSIH
jgi:hypothetical protein